MNRSTKTLTPWIAGLATALLLSGCGPDTLSSIQHGLEYPDGGYTFDEEMPAFGITGVGMQPVPVDFETTAASGADEGSRWPKRPEAVGVMYARWVDYARGHGTFLGKWADERGNVIGHVKGYYGKSTTHRGWVFFGKVIDLFGITRGLIGGRHENGIWRGGWADHDGSIIGALHGEATRSSFINGIMQGRWAMNPTSRTL